MEGVSFLVKRKQDQRSALRVKQGESKNLLRNFEARLTVDFANETESKARKVAANQKIDDEKHWRVVVNRWASDCEPLHTTSLLEKSRGLACYGMPVSSAGRSIQHKRKFLSRPLKRLRPACLNRRRSCSFEVQPASLRRSNKTASLSCAKSCKNYTLFEKAPERACRATEEESVIQAASRKVKFTSHNQFVRQTRRSSTTPSFDVSEWKCCCFSFVVLAVHICNCKADENFECDCSE